MSLYERQVGNWKWTVYQPEGTSKFYVKKTSSKTGKKVASDSGKYGSLAAAKIAVDISADRARKLV